MRPHKMQVYLLMSFFEANRLISFFFIIFMHINEFFHTFFLGVDMFSVTTVEPTGTAWPTKVANLCWNIIFL